MTEIGAPLLGCNRSQSDCRSAMADLAGTAQNNGFEMRALPSSVSELDIPADADVAFAGLYWSANTRGNDGWTGPLDEIELQAPGSAMVAVDGEVIAEVTDNAGRRYYQSFADVTALVRAGEPGQWAAQGAALAASQSQTDRSYHAGWSLVVVYATPESPDQNVTVYDGGAWVATDSSVTFAFEAGAERDGRIGVVAWDGDRGSSGNDRLSLNEKALTPIRWDGKPASTSDPTSDPTSDAFTSTAMGSALANSLGVDAKAFGSNELSDGINRLTASTAGDQYLIGVVTVQSSPR